MAGSLVGSLFVWLVGWLFVLFVGKGEDSEISDENGPSPVPNEIHTGGFWTTTPPAAHAGGHLMCQDGRWETSPQ